MSAMGNDESDNYEARQGDADAEYRREYNAWLAAMTPEERRRAESLGLAKPVVEDAGGGFGSRDIADTPLAAEWPKEVGEGEGEDGGNGVYPPMGTVVLSTEGGGGRNIDETVWDAVRRLVGEVLSQPDRSLAVECLALSSGMSYLGDSMSEVARRHGVTRAAVSKRCVELTDKLGLPPSRAMRSRAARESYRQTQLRIRNGHEKQKEGSKRHAEHDRNSGS
ncbi:MAG: hypothetical protein IT577_11465 [Verrucomicrobiae bacterium]|nr:hypothetical protein [Verrucomicrobiae bacterium]